MCALAALKVMMKFPIICFDWGFDSTGLDIIELYGKLTIDGDTRTIPGQCWFFIETFEESSSSWFNTFVLKLIYTDG